MRNNKDDVWEKLAAYFLVFIFALALGYTWRYAQEDVREKIDPDKIVVIRGKCGKGI